jgi:hypothetical protein
MVGLVLVGLVLVGLVLVGLLLVGLVLVGLLVLGREQGAPPTDGIKSPLDALLDGRYRTWCDLVHQVLDLACCLHALLDGPEDAHDVKGHEYEEGQDDYDGPQEDPRNMALVETEDDEHGPYDGHEADQQLEQAVGNRANPCLHDPIYHRGWIVNVRS